MKFFDNIFLSIGAMKSGTSWLANQLEDHPDIYLTPIKEIHYFAHVNSTVKFLDRNGRIEVLRSYIAWVNTDLHIDKLRQDLRWFDLYLKDSIDDAWFYDLYKERGQRRYCAEFSNIVAILNDEAWAHIKRLCRTIKVIYTLRDPVTRLWSHVRFQAAINGVFQHMPDWDEDQYRDFLNSGDILQHSSYSKTISTLRRNLEPDQFRLFYFEDFRDNPVNELRHLEQFLSISQKTYDNLAFRNPSLPLEIPESFLRASRDVISEELDMLDKLEIRIPRSWTRACGLGERTRSYLLEDKSNFEQTI
jgi:hypothetical protein